MDDKPQTANDPPEHHYAAWSFRITSSICLLALPLTLYVLSVGPVARHYWLKQGYPLPPKALIFYAPLDLLATKVPAFKTFISRYAAAWCTPPAEAMASSTTNQPTPISVH